MNLFHFWLFNTLHLLMQVSHTEWNTRSEGLWCAILPKGNSRMTRQNDIHPKDKEQKYWNFHEVFYVIFYSKMKLFINSSNTSKQGLWRKLSWRMGLHPTTWSVVRHLMQSFAVGVLCAKNLSILLILCKFNLLYFRLVL